jgi:hypothetical protein
VLVHFHLIFHARSRFTYRCEYMSMIMVLVI